MGISPWLVSCDQNQTTPAQPNFKHKLRAKGLNDWVETASQANMWFKHFDFTCYYIGPEHLVNMLPVCLLVVFWGSSSIPIQSISSGFSFAFRGSSKPSVLSCPPASQTLLFSLMHIEPRLGQVQQKHTYQAITLNVFKIHHFEASTGMRSRIRNMVALPPTGGHVGGSKMGEVQDGLPDRWRHGPNNSCGPVPGVSFRPMAIVIVPMPGLLASSVTVASMSTFTTSTASNPVRKKKVEEALLAILKAFPGKRKKKEQETNASTCALKTPQAWAIAPTFFGEFPFLTARFRVDI